MRQTIFLLTISTVLLACSNSDTTSTKNDIQAVEESTDISKSARQVLIQELKELRKVIASNDKEKIAGIFPFPLSDTAFSIYIDDSIYNEEFKANGNTTTKAMFLQHYKEISASVLVDQVNNLFIHLNIDSLLYKDSLEYNAYIKVEPCFYSYRIELLKDTVTLRMDMNSNRNYQNKELSDDDTPENGSEICEHAFWWIFKFDGKRLLLTNISGAD